MKATTKQNKPGRVTKINSQNISNGERKFYALFATTLASAESMMKNYEGMQYVCQHPDFKGVYIVTTCGGKIAIVNDGGVAVRTNGWSL